MNKARVGSALLALVVLAAWAQAAAPLAEKLPAGSVVYFAWTGRSLTFNGSMVGQMLAEPEMPALAGALKSAIRSQAPNDDDRALLDHLWAMASIGWQQPCAVGLFDVAAPGGEGPRRRRAPAPVGAFLVDLQKKRPEFERHFQAMLVLAGKKLQIAQAAAGDVTYHKFDTPAGPCGMGFVGEVFFLAVGANAPETVVALAGGKAPSLGKDPTFAAAMKAVSGEHVQFAYYVNVPRAYAVADRFAPAAGRAATAPAEGSTFRKAIKALGLDRVTAVAGAVSIVDRGMHEKVRVFSPAPHRRALALLTGGALPAGALGGAPADADVAATGRLDPARLLSEIRHVVTELDPRAGRQLESVLASAGEEIGLDVEKDLLAHIGDHWTILSAPSLGGFLTGTTVSVSIKDEAKLKQALEKLEGWIKTAIGGPPREDRPGGGMGIRSIKVGQTAIHYVAGTGPLPVMPVAPAWAVHKGRLHLAAFPQVLVAAVGGTGEKTLAETPAFAALRKRVSPTASALTYVNTPSLLRKFYGLALVGWTTAGNALAKRAGSAFEPGLFPALPKVAKYTWADIGAMSADAGGVTFESYGSGGMLLIGSPLQFLSLGTFLPTLGRARSQAKRATSAAHLRIIGTNCQIYAAEHDDRFPPDLATLVKYSGLGAQWLFSPSGGRKPPAAGAKLVGPFDYVYLGAKMTTDSPADMIVAYERPEINKNQGTNVLCADGSVRWLPMMAFRRRLASTQERLKRQGK